MVISRYLPLDTTGTNSDGGSGEQQRCDLGSHDFCDNLKCTNIISLIDRGL